MLRRRRSHGHLRERRAQCKCVSCCPPQRGAWSIVRDMEPYAKVRPKGKSMAASSVNMPDIRRVGLIGLGKMGLPMSRLLCQRGFAVAGFDVDEASMETAAGLGVQIALSPQ